MVAYGESSRSTSEHPWQSPSSGPAHSRFCIHSIFSHIGHEFIAAGMMILAGGGRGLPLDYDELERWTRVGFERGRRSRNGER